MNIIEIGRLGFHAAAPFALATIARASIPRAWIFSTSSEAKRRPSTASVHFDQTEPNFRKLVFQIERLAMDIERSVGAPWYADQRAFAVFQEVLRLVLRDLPQPSEQKSTIKADAATAADLIYRRYLAIVREWEDGSEPEMRTPLSHILERGKDDG
jgi:hypothetical protein